MTRLIALALSVCLALAGCSSSPELDGVKVQRSAKSVKLQVPDNFNVTKTEIRTIDKGTGAPIGDQDTAKVDYVAYNGRTGKQFDTSYGREPMTLAMSGGQTLPGFIKAIKDQRVGAKVLVAVAPYDGFQAERPELGLKKSDTIVIYFDVRSKVAQAAKGKTKKLPADVPSVVLNNDQPSGFAKTSATPATLSAASSHVVIQGTGPKVKRGGSITAHYLGQVYPDGDVFDSSWRKGTPASFSLSGVIPCWTNLLPGVRVGSRVVLLCPNADAYGDSPPQGSAIKPGDSLMFVVDVLDAS